MPEAYTPAQQAMIHLFQQHVAAELEGDLETTMATMTDDPHLNHVPTMAGGNGREGVRKFYATALEAVPRSGKTVTGNFSNFVSSNKFKRNI